MQMWFKLQLVRCNYWEENTSPLTHKPYYNNSRLHCFCIFNLGSARRLIAIPSAVLWHSILSVVKCFGEYDAVVSLPFIWIVITNCMFSVVKVTRNLFDLQKKCGDILFPEYTTLLLMPRILQLPMWPAYPQVILMLFLPRLPKTKLKLLLLSELQVLLVWSGLQRVPVLLLIP